MEVKDKESEEIRTEVVRSMKKWGQKYPDAGYGRKFYWWLKANDPQPYGSWGNGSAMRVSSAGWLFDTIEETRKAARLTAEVTHNHPEGIKGAEATAAAIFLARTGSTKEGIREYIVREFGYDLSRTCDEIRPGYHHVESCQETVPEAITAFLEGNDFEDVIRTAVSLGGDCDTLTCIAGGIAEAFYGVPEEMKAECRRRLPEDMKEVLDRFTKVLEKREEYDDPFLEGNDEIETAIEAYYRESSRETLIGVLDAIRKRMNEDGHFIVPVFISEDRTKFEFRTIMVSDGKIWHVVFTSQEEMSKGAPSQTLSYFIDQALEGCIETGHDGYIINPWGQSFTLTRELIELLYEADKNWQEEICERLKDGSMLKDAIESCKEEPSQRRFSKLLRTLRSSYVWVPFTAVLSERDQKRFEEMVMPKIDNLDVLVGETFVNSDEIRFIPDTLENGEECFFPAFTSEEEMGEYGKRFSTIQMSLPEALALARKNEKNVSGIVVNAFTDNYILNRELFEYVEKLPSYFKDTNIEKGTDDSDTDRKEKENER